MEFGRVQDLDGIDLRLPDPDPRSVALLARHGPGPVTVRIGAPTWTKGFPPGPDPLRRYATRFTAVELNASFYAVPEPRIVEGWRSAVPPRFRFCPKVPRSISRGNGEWGRDVRPFLASIAGFGPALGPCFFQAPPEVGPVDLPELRRRVEAVSPVALELRHPGFFPIADALFAWMAGAGVGTVVTDTPGRRDAVHGVLTTPVLFLRFMAWPHPTMAHRLAAWVERVRWWAARGLREAWVFVHAPDDIGLPALLDQATLAFGDLCVAPERPRQMGLFGG